MTDVERLQKELVRQKSRVPRGGQRELARRIGAHPNKIADAFGELVNDLAFLQKLVAETSSLIKEKWTPKKSGLQSKSTASANA